MGKNRISWTDKTWNPCTGCTKLSPGCMHCYAESMTKRLVGKGLPKYKNGFKLTVHPQTLTIPDHWRKPRKIFVNSMSDLFHKDTPISFIQDVFNVAKRNERHIFQILTKRADLLLYYDQQGYLEWHDNIWMGVSVEDQQTTCRIDMLRQTGAKHKFLSCEPLLSGLPNMNLNGIDWLIVGGESGPGSRPLEAAWVEDIRDQCHDADVLFHFKQWGGRSPKKNGRLLNGILHDAMPEV
jgi:protein gp37